MTAQNSIKYGTRKKECYRIYDNSLGFVDRTNDNVGFLLNKWNEIENFEYSKRKNGKVLSKIILMFPNEWSQSQKEDLVETFFEEKFSKNHHFTFCFHGGKDGEVTLNSHGHLYFSERKLNDPKNRKDPAMSKMGYIDKFAKEWQKACGIDLSRQPKVSRIPMKQWKKNPDLSRDLKQKRKLELLQIQNELEIANKKVLFIDKVILRIKNSYKKALKFRDKNSMPSSNQIHELVLSSNRFSDLIRKQEIEKNKKNEIEKINQLLKCIYDFIDRGDFKYDFSINDQQNIDSCIFEVRKLYVLNLEDNFSWSDNPKLSDILYNVITEQKQLQLNNQYLR